MFKELFAMRKCWLAALLMVVVGISFDRIGKSLVALHAKGTIMLRRKPYAEFLCFFAKRALDVLIRFGVIRARNNTPDIGSPFNSVDLEFTVLHENRLFWVAYLINSALEWMPRRE